MIARRILKGEFINFLDNLKRGWREGVETCRCISTRIMQEEGWCCESVMRSEMREEFISWEKLRCWKTPRRPSKDISMFRGPLEGLLCLEDLWEAFYI